MNQPSRTVSATVSTMTGSDFWAMVTNILTTSPDISVWHAVKLYIDDFGPSCPSISLYNQTQDAIDRLSI